MEWKLPDNLKDWLQLLAFVPALITVYKVPAILGFFVRRWVKLVEWVKMKISMAVATAIMAQLQPALTAIENSVEEVRKQVFPNGGGSMNDSLKRVSNIVEEHSRSSKLFRSTMLAHQDADLTKARFETDENGDIIWFSYALQAWTGRSSEQTEGMGWLTSVVEQDRHRVRAEWMAAKAESRDFLSSFLMQHASGETFPVQMFAKHVGDADFPGCLVGAMSRVVAAG